jgi:hypothetical protein
MRRHAAYSTHTWLHQPSELTAERLVQSGVDIDTIETQSTDKMDFLIGSIDALPSELSRQILSSRMTSAGLPSLPAVGALPNPVRGSCGVSEQTTSVPMLAQRSQGGPSEATSSSTLVSASFLRPSDAYAQFNVGPHGVRALPKQFTPEAEPEHGPRRSYSRLQPAPVQDQDDFTLGNAVFGEHSHMKGKLEHNAHSGPTGWSESLFAEPLGRVDHRDALAAWTHRPVGMADEGGGGLSEWNQNHAHSQRATTR